MDKKMDYDELVKYYKGDKNKAYMHCRMIECMEGLFEELGEDCFTDDMKISMTIDSQYYEFNKTETIKGDEYKEKE